MFVTYSGKKFRPQLGPAFLVLSLIHLIRQYLRAYEVYEQDRFYL